MQIQRIDTQPSFRAMHFIQVKPKAIASNFSAEDTQKAASVAILNLKSIFSQFMMIAPESHISTKRPDRNLFAINFPKGMEQVESGFVSILNKAKGLVPLDLIDHKFIMGAPDDLPLQKAFEKFIEPRKGIGFKLAGELSEDAPKIPKHTVITGFSKAGDTFEKQPSTPVKKKTIGFIKPKEQDAPAIPKHRPIKGFEPVEPQRVAAESKENLN